MAHVMHAGAYLQVRKELKGGCVVLWPPRVRQHTQQLCVLVHHTLGVKRGLLHQAVPVQLQHHQLLEQDEACTRGVWV